MNARTEFDVWRWTVRAGVVVLVLVGAHRVCTRALDLVDDGLRAYERAHEPITQRTVTTWPSAGEQQQVETSRGPSDELTGWLQGHSAAVLASDQWARERAQLRASTEVDKR